MAKCLLILLIFTAGCTDEESRRQVEVLRQLATDTPLFPGFVQIGSGTDWNKPNHAGVVRCYSVRANDEEVKTFYTRYFQSKGWSLDEKQELGGFHYQGSYILTFRKGQYAFKFGYENIDNPSGVCNYTLSYHWDQFYWNSK